MTENKINGITEAILNAHRVFAEQGKAGITTAVQVGNMDSCGFSGLSGLLVGRATFPREYSSEIKEEHMGRHARGRFAQPFLSVMYGTFTGISNSVGSFGSDPDELPLTSEAFDPRQRIEGFQTRGFLSLVRLTGCSYEFTEDVRGGLYMPNTMLFTDTGENIDEVRSVHDDRDILGRQTAVFMYKPFAEVLGLEVGQPFMQAASRIAEFYGGLSKPGWEVRNS